MSEVSNTPRNLDSNIVNKNSPVLPKNIDQKIDAKISEKKSAELKIINNQTLDELFKFQYGMIESEISSINDTDAGAKLQDGYDNFKGKFENTLQTLKMGEDMQKAYAGDKTKDFDYDKRNLELKKDAWKSLVDFQMQVENLKTTFPNQSEKILKTLSMLKKNFSKRYSFDAKTSVENASNFPAQNIQDIISNLEDLPGGFFQSADSETSILIKNIQLLNQSLNTDLSKTQASKKIILSLIEKYKSGEYKDYALVQNSLKQNLPVIIKYYNSKAGTNKIQELK